MSAKNENSKPGAGAGRPAQSTTFFRILNFELFVKPNKVIMGAGLLAFAGVLGYIGYMRSKYESAGYYAAMQEDGTEVYIKTKSKWDS